MLISSYRNYFSCEMQEKDIFSGNCVEMLVVGKKFSVIVISLKRSHSTAFFRRSYFLCVSSVCDHCFFWVFLVQGFCAFEWKSGIRRGKGREDKEGRERKIEKNREQEEKDKEIERESNEENFFWITRAVPGNLSLSLYLSLCIVYRKNSTQEDWKT